MKFQVQIYDSGPGGEARVKTLFNFMQAAADSHSRGLGTSISDISTENITWVYSRFYIRISRFPEIYESVECETWRSPGGAHSICRNFIITDKGGNRIATASAFLVVIDKTTRRKTVLPEMIVSQLDNSGKNAVDYDFPVLETIEDADYVCSSEVRYEDMDINNHMNNSAFAQLIFESVYRNHHSVPVLKSLDIVFLGEGSSGDELECAVQVDRNDRRRCMHKISLKKTGRIIAVAGSEWGSPLL